MIPAATAKRILFCRSGGGIPGIQRHAGMWQALSDRGIVATHCAGTSAGAVVSLFDALRHDPHTLMLFSDRFRDADLRDDKFAWKLRIPWLDWFIRGRKIEGLLNDFAHGRAIEKSLTINATAVADGSAREYHFLPQMLNRHSFIDAVMGSMAISGVFPHRNVSGEMVCDGGVQNNAALPSDWRWNDEVWILIGTGDRDNFHGGHGILTRLMRNVSYLMRDQTLDALRTTRVIPLDAQMLRSTDQARVDQIVRAGYGASRVTFQTDLPGVMHTCRVFALWPSFPDLGALHICPGLHKRVEAWTRSALLDLEAKGYDRA